MPLSYINHIKVHIHKYYSLLSQSMRQAYCTYYDKSMFTVLAEASNNLRYDCECADARVHGTYKSSYFYRLGVKSNFIRTPRARTHSKIQATVGKTAALGITEHRWKNAEKVLVLYKKKYSWPNGWMGNYTYADTSPSDSWSWLYNSVVFATLLYPYLYYSIHCGCGRETVTKIRIRDGSEICSAVSLV